ncbi:MAG: ferritin [Bacteroidetes bacterium]|nr:ferritin [Bacteroidota bacterium]MBL6942796.1 ferritin [Bacteroidales bacterium]
MINLKVQSALNDQIKKEEFSSRLYVAMAIWCETKGYPGAAKFLFSHSEEERMHMLKLVHYTNDRGGKAQLAHIEQPDDEFSSLLDVFEKVMEHEKYVTASINSLYEVTVHEKDYTTMNFLQWFITEQVEEESLFNNILDKIKLVGTDKAGMFHIDKELDGMAVAPAPIV